MFDIDKYKRQFEIKKGIGRLNFDTHIIALQFNNKNKEARDFYEEFIQYCFNQIKNQL